MEQKNKYVTERISNLDGLNEKISKSIVLIDKFKGMSNEEVDVDILLEIKETLTEITEYQLQIKHVVI